MADFYRPQVNGHRQHNDSYRPMHAPPERDRFGPSPTPGSRSAAPRQHVPMHHFGQDQDAGQERREFSFRPGTNAPAYPDHEPSERPRRPPFDYRRPRGDGARRFQGRRYGRAATADRPLLKFQRGSTPEQLEGMKEESESRFVNPDDVSDSEELSMVESDSDTQAANDSPEDAIASTKRRKLQIDRVDDAPKWSNPELYTSLPPLDDTTDRKRKDVVKLIRKSRVQASKVTQPVAGVDDFIKFDFDATDEGNLKTTDASVDPQTKGFPHPSAAQTDFRKEINALSTVSILYEDSVASRLDGKRKRDPRDVGNPLQQESAASSAHDTFHQRALAAQGLQEPVHRRGRGKFGGGHLLEEWAFNEETNSTPWIGRKIPVATSPSLRLHQEICEFYALVRPRPFEQDMRDALVGRLNNFVQREFGKSCSVYAFGSFAAGLYLPNADMDLVVLSERFRYDGEPVFGQSKGQMYNLARQFEQSGFARTGSVEVVAHAKVPIIKFIDNITQLQVDLSFENDSGIVANRTFLRWKDRHPAMPALTVVIKQFLMMRGLNNNATGGLGGFAVVCLVVLLLEKLPRVQSREVKPELNLGEMLLEFLDFYGNQLDISRLALRMDDPPGIVDKNFIQIRGVNGPNKAGRLCIIDPNRLDNDISGGAKEIMLIFRRFAEAREDILEAMRDQKSPFLLPLRGNYNDFLWHRFRLQELHERSSDIFKGDSAEQANLTDIDSGGTESNQAFTEQQFHAPAIVASALPVSATRSRSVQNLLAGLAIDGSHDLIKDAPIAVNLPSEGNQENTSSTTEAKDMGQCYNNSEDGGHRDTQALRCLAFRAHLTATRKREWGRARNRAMDFKKSHPAFANIPRVLSRSDLLAARQWIKEGKTQGEIRLAGLERKRLKMSHYIRASFPHMQDIPADVPLDFYRTALRRLKQHQYRPARQRSAEHRH